MNKLTIFKRFTLAALAAIALDLGFAAAVLAWGGGSLLAAPAVGGCRSEVIEKVYENRPEQPRTLRIHTRFASSIEIIDDSGRSVIKLPYPNTDSWSETVFTVPGAGIYSAVAIDERGCENRFNFEVKQ
jgi:hypothetical protein